MAVFIAYSSRDKAALNLLSETLLQADLDVWFDGRLGGDELWWRAVLERIRDCEVFVVALSQSFLDTKACRAELEYAQALGKPIVPVQVGQLDHSQANPLAGMHAVDFLRLTVGGGSELTSSVLAQREGGRRLPDPLPIEPRRPGVGVNDPRPPPMGAQPLPPGAPRFGMGAAPPYGSSGPPTSSAPSPPGPPRFGMGAPPPAGPPPSWASPAPLPPGPPGYGFGAMLPPPSAATGGSRGRSRTPWLIAGVAAAVIVVVVVVLVVAL